MNPTSPCRVADWFAQLNNKMGGDLKKIQNVGRYLVEIWKAVGMDMTRVEFLNASEEINRRPDEYWTLVMDVARKNSLKRVVRCSQIMGRSDTEELSAAQIFYPCMQCADIFFLKADICQLGMDQRKVNMLAREYAEDCKPKRLKPIVLSHEMVPGLQQGQEKMSKSDPNSAIFMEDSEAEVKTKIKKAYCPPAVVEGNPCLAYIRMIILPWCRHFELQRGEDNGGDKCVGCLFCLGGSQALLLVFLLLFFLFWVGGTSGVQTPMLHGMPHLCSPCYQPLTLPCPCPRPAVQSVHHFCRARSRLHLRCGTPWRPQALPDPPPQRHSAAGARPL